MNTLDIPFEDRTIQFDYFVDTITIGEQQYSPICNIYTFITKDEEAKRYVGEAFHVVHETTGQFERPYLFPLRSTRLTNEGKKEDEIKRAILDVIAHP